MRRRRAEHHKGHGLIEWFVPLEGLYPYHVTILTFAGPQYLGVCATLREARQAIRDNT